MKIERQTRKPHWSVYVWYLALTMALLGFLLLPLVFLCISSK